MSQKQILLVDDEPGVRFVLTAVLEQSGHTVDQAEDGLAALRKIQQRKPDLVITDLRMPNMNGFEPLFEIRTKFPEIPCVAISGEFLTVAARDHRRPGKGGRSSWGMLPIHLPRLLSSVHQTILPYARAAEKPLKWKSQ